MHQNKTKTKENWEWKKPFLKWIFPTSKNVYFFCSLLSDARMSTIWFYNYHLFYRIFRSRSFRFYGWQWGIIWFNYETLTTFLWFIFFLSCFCCCCCWNYIFYAPFFLLLSFSSVCSSSAILTTNATAHAYRIVIKATATDTHTRASKKK